MYRATAILLVDTAGIRRRARVEGAVEARSVLRAIRAAARADVVVLLVDAGEGVADQDARVAGLAVERGRGLVVALNESDLLSPGELARRRETAADAPRLLRRAPIVAISARTEPNRFFESVLARHPPPTHRGRAPRVYYVTQAGTRPPTLVAMCSSAGHVKESYRRYVSNQIRRAFGFDGVPIVLELRERRRRE